MILRRFGDTIESVEPKFEAHALTEINFRRDGRWSLPVQTFEDIYRRVEERELAPEATGWVQSETEAEVLTRLRRTLDGWLGNLDDAEVLVVENERGADYPKTKEQRDEVLIEGENRHRFHWRVDPPLRIGIYQREG